ncbi:ROK family protein [Nonomuraea angiospora]|uniref:NBD/HSP70 family sugar kinase n=1 Tax=Nonomuraea angiospora TaxID=46172 RepID=A0ABR9LS96_9ACTN|nr:ROK family transcriptional regulator [Nonomuraea angiospora]MBE1583529.1 putative NBD/HSP70 family sugar kinase [Nonomuraea angiospora]
MTEERPAGTPVLRRMNRAAVLDAVRRRAPEPVRVAELARLTELTRPTVAQAVEDLLAAGWLRQVAPEQATVGRPATRFSLNGRAAPVLALDVGPHTVTAGIADLAGERLATIRRPVGRRGARHLLEAVDEATGAALAAAGLTAGQIAAVTAATPGIVEETTGRVLFAPSVPGWPEIDLAGRLRARFRCAVTVENDANLAALAAVHRRAGAGTLLAVQWGERLGAGVVIDGRLHRGAGQAGEIGFIRPTGVLPGPASGLPDPASGLPDAAGDLPNPTGDLPDPVGDGRGPLERAIGAEAIVDLARRRAAGRPECRLARVTDAAAVFAAAADGDPMAVAVVDQVAAVFAQAIAPAVLVLSPHAIVIGGGIARAGAVLLDAIARHLADLVLTPPSVELSELAEGTVLTGAIQLALEEVWRDTLAGC